MAQRARRRALLVATVRELEVDLTDAALAMFDGFVGRAWRRSEKPGAERTASLEQAGKERLDRLADALDAGAVAHHDGKDAHAALIAMQSWEELALSAQQLRQLLRPEPADLIANLDPDYAVFRHIGPRLLARFTFEGAPFVRPLLTALDQLRDLAAHPRRSVPATAPITFISRRWRRHVVVDGKGFNRRFYELCVFFELRDRLRAGDVWVQGSRQYRSLNECLAPPLVPVLPPPAIARLPAYPTAEAYLGERMARLDRRLRETAGMLEAETADGITMVGGKLKLRRPGADDRPEADRLADRLYRMVPPIRITDLLDEVDGWTDLIGHFGHVQTGRPPSDRRAFLATLIAEASNLGLARMAQVCPVATRRQLLWITTWHTREETYRTGLARLVEAQHREPMGRWFGGGNGATSDGQHFFLGGAGESAGEVNAHYGRDPAVKLYTHISDRYAPFHVTVTVNAHYGREPGVKFYTHLSDRFAPFHTRAISATAGEAIHVLDGLLHQAGAADADNREATWTHHTDGGGVSDHVFALCALLGFRFAPRIPDLKDRKLHSFQAPASYPTLAPLIGGRIDVALIRSHWTEILRLALSIKTGAVGASVILRQLGAYPRQNGLALALRELGRLERTLFTLDWLEDPAFRRQAGRELNKGEARNSLARAVFIHRLGEIRDRTYENQQHRASGLNLVVGAIMLWNTRYLEHAIATLRKTTPIADDLLAHLSPLGWEHINLTGDYLWTPRLSENKGGLRLLRIIPSDLRQAA